MALPPDEFPHAAGANLDYEIDWTPWLDAGDTISTDSWVVTGPDTALVLGTHSHTPTTATVWLSGGTAGSSYRVTGTIITAANRTDLRTIKINAVAR